MVMRRLAAVGGEADTGLVPNVSITVGSPGAGWPPGEERRVVSIVRRCLEEAGGTWQVTASPCGVLADWWVLEVARPDDGTRRRVFLDIAAPEPVLGLRTALQGVARAETSGGDDG